MSGLTIGSLFTGAGMLDRAAEEVFGARTAWVSDVDPGACAILAHRFPGVPNLGDITTVDWSAVEPVDVICGGSPCQDVSHAGRRAGMTEGTRSNLWAAMREAIAALRPQLVIWENVDGAHSADADSALEPCPGCVGDRRGGAVLRALGRVLGDLASLGYDAEWISLRAADVGACHGRRRVFVLAYAHGIGRGEQWRAESVGVNTREQIALLPTPTVSDANGPGHHGAGGADLRTTVRLLPTPRVENNENRQSEGYGGVRGNFHGLLTGAASWGDYAEAIARHERAFGRPAPEPTEPGPKGQPRLSARFVEWMMCLPAGWVTDVPGITRNAQLKALGNGVVVPQAAHALRVMLGRLP